LIEKERNELNLLYPCLGSKYQSLFVDQDVSGYKLEWVMNTFLSIFYEHFLNKTTTCVLCCVVLLKWMYEQASNQSILFTFYWSMSYWKTTNE
jgi:hypothetical protein